MVDYLCLAYFKKVDNIFSVPLESLVTLFVCKYVDSIDLKIYLIKDNFLGPSSFDVEIDLKLNFEYWCKNIEQLSKTPYMFIDQNTLISGLCAVNRQIIKSSSKLGIENLLGFKNACLKAPNEVSIWTKFCEIDMIAAVNNLFNDDLIIDKNNFNLPIDIIRFENHMSQPVRIHNIYKIAQNQNKSVDFKTINSTPKDNLNIPHLFVEGPFMTIADIILWPQIYLIFKKISIDEVSLKLPLTINWYNTMLKNSKINLSSSFIKTKSHLFSNIFYIKSEIKSESLYKSDPKRYKPQNRIYTKQNDIDIALIKIDQLSVKICDPEKPFGYEIELDLNLIPIADLIQSEALPPSRVKRKYDQLLNLTKAVVKLAKIDDVIVDFCCGSGHLGIILARLLPNCNIILLENKEESLNRAKDRIEILQLKNIKLLQCNLDYFNGNFNIGVSLHACGVATDLVIQQCILKRASLVCCPCCYGGVHNCHHLTYPRSQIFQNSDLTLKDYLVLGHSADQTHDKANLKTKQGELCMNIIDNDRMLQAKEMGYTVCLGKLEPVSCTPKNNLLVGWLD